MLRSHYEGEAARVRFDEHADALYVRLDESPVVESEEVRPGVALDLDERGEIVGIEILRVGQRLPTA
ncbi:MAG TPA: DUF2283 domain-containing protein, partial [Thermoleophilia bacterium]